MTAATARYPRRQPRLRSSTYYESLTTEVQVNREALKLRMVDVLRAAGEPMPAATLARAVDASPMMVGQLAAAMPRTFCWHRQEIVQERRTNTVFVDLHCHLKGPPP